MCIISNTADAAIYIYTFLKQCATTVTVNIQVFYLLLAESNIAPHQLHIKRRELCGRLSTVLVDIGDVLGQSGQEGEKGEQLITETLH